jgi:hypothetical protein
VGVVVRVVVSNGEARWLLPIIRGLTHPSHPVLWLIRIDARPGRCTLSKDRLTKVSNTSRRGRSGRNRFGKETRRRPDGVGSDHLGRGRFIRH